jgi:hypothetical protein
MQRLVKHLVRLDCEWALTTVVRLIEKEKAHPIWHNLRHLTRVTQRTWRYTFPLRIWKVHGKKIEIISTDNIPPLISTLARWKFAIKMQPFLFCVMPPKYGRTEFTLEDLQQLPEKQAVSLLAKRLSYAMSNTETITRDYFNILSRYTGNHAAVWQKMLDVNEMNFSSDRNIFNSLVKYVKQHPPSPEMCQASLGPLIMAPEYLLLFFNNAATPVQPIDPLHPHWTQFEESIWDNISIAEMKLLIYRGDGTPSNVFVWRGAHPYLPADYCLVKVIQHGRVDLIRWIIKNCNLSWHDLDCYVASMPFQAFSTALAYKKVVRPYLLALRFRIDFDYVRACRFVKTVENHIQKDPSKWLLIESLERIRREMQEDDLAIDPTVERLYELCLEMPVVDLLQ